MHTMIFTGGQAPLPYNTVFYFSKLKQIDTVIAADSGLDTLEAFGQFYGSTYDLTPDYIIGDMDSLHDTALLSKYPKARCEKYSRDKDYSDTELALIKAREFHTEDSPLTVTLIGGCGGCIDHLMAVLDTFSFPFHADYWLCEHETVCYLEDGDVLKIANVHPDDRISVSRTTASFEGGKIKTEGLMWESPLFRKKGMPSLSNRAVKGYGSNKKPVTIRVETGTFLVTEPINAVLTKESSGSSVQ